MKKWKNIIDQYIASGDRNIEEPNEFTFNQCQLNQTARCVICNISYGPSVWLILGLS